MSFTRITNITKFSAQSRQKIQAGKNAIEGGRTNWKTTKSHRHSPLLGVSSWGMAAAVSSSVFGLGSDGANHVRATMQSEKKIEKPD